MDWKNILPVLNKLAPSIAATLGGPLAGGAVTALQEVFGIKPVGTPTQQQDELVAAISGATPDQLLAVKKADQDYAVQMATLGFKNVEQLEQLASSDRDSARKREIEVKDSTPRNLAYLITLGFFGVLAFLLFAEVPMGSRDILNIMLGSLGTAWIGVVGYYYGSTSGSQVKTQLLAKADAIKQELF